MARIIGFEQDPKAQPGAGLFKFDSGAELYAYEPEEAARVRSALEVAPDQRIAGNPGAPMATPNNDALLASRNAQTGKLPDVWYDDPASPVDRGTGQSMPPAPAGPVALPEVAVTPTATDALARQAQEAARRQAAEELIHGKLTGGSPGRDPRREIQSGVFVPKAGTVERESGAPYDPTLAEERFKANEAVLGARMTEAGVRQQQAQNDLAAAEAAAPELAARQAQAQTEMQAMQANYRRQRAKLQADVDAVASRKIDPNRFFKDAGTIPTIGMIIGQAMGAYGATLGGAPNWAFEAVQRGIDRDIAAQRDEIERGTANTQNALRTLMDDHGWDLEQAEAAARVAGAQLASNEARRYGLGQQIPQLRAASETMAAEFAQKAMLEEQAFFNASFGKERRVVSEEFAQPRAATGPGRKPLTGAERKSALEVLGSGGTVSEEDWVALEPKKRVEVQMKYGEDKGAVAATRKVYDQLATTYGAKINWETGEVLDTATGQPLDPEKWAGISGHGATGFVPDIMTTREGMNVRQAQGRALSAEIKAMSGATATDQEVERLRRVRFGSTDSDAAYGLLKGVEDVNAKDRELDASVPEQVVRERRRRAGTVNVDRNQRAAATPQTEDY